jgi:protocatechuate 3,4-dioxygenase beta subunit
MLESATSVTLLRLLWLACLAAFTTVAGAQQAPTPESDTGPMYRADAPEVVNFWRPGDPGQPMNIVGQVRGTDGKPIAGATLHVWQADGNGEYQEDRYRATLQTDTDGSYRISTVLPGQYYGVKHIHMAVSHHRYESLTTRILFKGDPNLDQYAQSELAIHLEEALVKGKTMLFGRFDIVMRPLGGG